MLRLEFPNESHQEMYEDMLEEWESFEEIPTSPSLLFKWESYSDFLDVIRQVQRGEYLDYAPSSLFY